MKLNFFEINLILFILYFRSFYLSLEIKKALRNQPNQNQAISLICPNGASYVIGQWAIWMSGNMMVPISPQLPPDALEYFIKDSKSACVISANCILDKVCIIVLSTKMFEKNLYRKNHGNVMAAVEYYRY